MMQEKFLIISVSYKSQGFGGQTEMSDCQSFLIASERKESRQLITIDLFYVKEYIIICIEQNIDEKDRIKCRYSKMCVK